MKKIWVVVLVFVLPLIFAPKVNSQVVSSEPTKAEINQLFKTVPLVKMDKYGAPVKEPRFGIEVGLGSSYQLGERSSGILSYYKDATASSLRVGYSLSKYVKVQWEYSNSGKFKGKAMDTTSYQTRTRSFSPVTLNLKTGVPVMVKQTKLFPYAVVGAGTAKTKDSGYYKSSVIEFTHGQTTKEPCTKIGIGIEVEIRNNIYLFSEFSKWRANWTNEFDQTKYVFLYKQVLVGVGIKFQ